MGIDTNDVLDAAATKWNFLRFEPGLVGGHCIGVDPYYLTYKAQRLGYHPDIILAGRQLNDGMAAYVCGELMKKMNHKSLLNLNTELLVLGLTFKQDCPDTRNSKVFDLINEFRAFGLKVSVYDPLVDPSSLPRDFPLLSDQQLCDRKFDCVVIGCTSCAVC